MHPRDRYILSLLAFCAAFFPADKAYAHPVAQGSLDVVITPGKITLWARLSVEEVVLSNSMRVSENDRYESLSDAYRNHGQYWIKHVFVRADGKLLVGSLGKINEPDKKEGIGPLETEKEFVVYVYEFSFEGKPGEITLSQNVLNEINYVPGNRWEATYSVRIGQHEKNTAEAKLLTSEKPLVFKCDWTAPSAGQPATAAPAGKEPASHATTVMLNSGGLFKEYLLHGIHHILQGWDHLLFVSALVLAAASVWDLVKVVSAFTLAHTITLTLSALDVVRLPEKIVEPMIAASIVCVALWNILWPEKSRGWARLTLAFFFGLFHGLGFAGGLLNAMQGLDGSMILSSIVAFSIGVEIGHQAVVLPLFGALKVARATKKDETAQKQISDASLRYGSVIISMAGMFYLLGALGWI